MAWGGQLQSRGPRATSAYRRSSALDRDPDVGRDHRDGPPPFDPAEQGWTKTEYRQGDILDRDAVDALVADADVVVHLAFIIMGSREESARVNLAGTRNVFEATVAAHRPRRLVYTSSVAAYGYHSDNPVPITEEVPPRGSPEHYYSEQKAACEAVLAEITAGSDARGLRAAALHRRRAEGARAGRSDAVEPTARTRCEQVSQAVPAAQAALPGPGHAGAAGAPRRRRRRNRFGRNDFRASGCLQPRRRRRGVDVGCRRGARRPARPGARGSRRRQRPK